MLAIARTSESNATRVAAAKAIIERGYGTPLSRLEEGKLADFSDWSDDALRNHIMEETRALGLHSAGTKAPRGTHAFRDTSLTSSRPQPEIDSSPFTDGWPGSFCFLSAPRLFPTRR